MLTKVIDILEKAKEGGYAVGAFNVINLETAQAVIESAVELKSPVIVQITETTMKYAGGEIIFNLVKDIAEQGYPESLVGIHLDHGKSFEIIKKAIDIGFTSVMYDGSRKSYEDNLLMTQKIGGYCQKKNVSIQAELGNVPYLSEIGMSDIDWNEYMTNPQQAKDFVGKTKVNALAVAIGNAHDFAKEREKPDYERLAEIRNLLDIPIIMHGTSDWGEEKVSQAVQAGANCFNVDTAIKTAFTNSLKENFSNDRKINFDIRKYLGEARTASKNVIKNKIKIFGSVGRIEQ